jgi:hypothetical protein
MVVPALRAFTHDLPPPMSAQGPRQEGCGLERSLSGPGAETDARNVSNNPTSTLSPSDALPPRPRPRRCPHAPKPGDTTTMTDRSMTACALDIADLWNDDFRLDRELSPTAVMFAGLRLTPDLPSIFQLLGRRGARRRIGVRAHRWYFLPTRICIETLQVTFILDRYRR